MKKNNQFWFWGFMVLAILLISAVTTIGIRTYRFNNNDTTNTSDSIKSNNRGERGQGGSKGMCKGYNFTNKQRKFFRQERHQHQQKLRDIKNKQKLNNNKLFNEISKSSPDNDSIKIYKKAILESNEEIIDETIKHYETLKTRLSQEQMQKVNNHVSKKLRRRHNR